MKTLPKIKLALLAGTIAILCSCASQDGKDRVADAKAYQKVIDAKNADIEDKLDKIPGWVLNPPKPDAYGVFAVGIGDSNTLQVSQKKAMLEAEFGLAKQFQQELAGSERQYTTDDSVSGVNRYEGLIDKLVQRVPIVGYTVKKQEVKAVDGKYQTYVLLSLPYDQYNEVLKAQKSKETSKEMKDAFDELEKRLEKRRNEGAATVTLSNPVENEVTQVQTIQ